MKSESHVDELCRLKPLLPYTIHCWFQCLCAWKTASDLRAVPYTHGCLVPQHRAQHRQGFRECLLNGSMRDQLWTTQGKVPTHECGNSRSPGSVQPSFSGYSRKTALAVRACGTEVCGSRAMSPKGPCVKRHTETTLPHHFLCCRRLLRGCGCGPPTYMWKEAPVRPQKEECVKADPGF